MSTAETSTRLWVAYGSGGVAGSIRADDEGYTVTMAGADAPLGVYPTMEVAKAALHSRMPADANWPTFREH